MGSGLEMTVFGFVHDAFSSSGEAKQLVPMPGCAGVGSLGFIE
jgi:hypothetical protein